MNRNDLFPSKFVKATDLQGREWPVVISHLTIEQLEGQNGKEPKGVIHFQQHCKPLVLNVVNFNTIAAVYGEETDHWGGCAITLYPTKTQFGAKMVDCIRVKIPEQPAGQPTATPAGGAPLDVNAELQAVGDDDVPFDLPLT